MCFLPGERPPTALREAALDGFSRAAVKLAEQRISEGRFQDATTTVTVVLEDRYNPTYTPALDLEAKLKDPTRYNRALTPGFIANVEEVKELLLEAEGFILPAASISPSSATSRSSTSITITSPPAAVTERVNLARQKYAETAYNESRAL